MDTPKPLSEGLTQRELLDLFDRTAMYPELRAAIRNILRPEPVADALASDGPIRDSDVKDAVKRNRPRIEAEARADLLATIRARILAYGDTLAYRPDDPDPDVVIAECLAILDRFSESDR